MATFTGTANADVANATTGAVTGFTVTGGSGNNVADLQDSIGDVFYGEGNSDTIVAGGGDDYILGGLGADSLNGGGGDDTFIFSSIILSGTSDIVAGEVIAGGSGTDTLKANGGIDFTPATITSIERVTVGPDFPFVIFSTAQFGGSGISVSLIVDYGTSATLSISVDTTNSAPVFSAAAWTFTGGLPPSNHGVNISDQDTVASILTGTSRNDFFEAGTGADSLYGGDGSDFFSFRSSTDLQAGDVVDGGAGSDSLSIMSDHFSGTVTLSFDFSVAGVQSIDRLSLSTSYGTASVLNLNFGAAQVGTGLASNLDITNILNVTTNLVFTAAPAGATNVNLSGFTFTTFTGIPSATWDANDTITIHGAAEADTLVGSIQADTIIAAGGNDTLYGGLGNDNISGDGGADYMAGGIGDDRFVVDTYAGEAVVELANEGTDVVYAMIDYTVGLNIEQIILVEGSAAVNAGGGADANVIIGNSANNVIYGYGGDDILVGNGGTDSLLGMEGNDAMDGGAGNDQMIGGIGNDSFVINSLSDVAAENPGEGIDTVYAEIDYTIGGNIEQLILREGTAAVNGGGDNGDNVIVGNSAANTIYGYGGNDTLYGFANNDIMLGLDGNDTLDGGTGNDQLFGGTGTDKFKFIAGDGADTIFDFNRGEGDQVLISTGMASNFSTLIANHASIVGGNVQLSFAGGQTIAMLGFGSVASLIDSDFLFF